MGKKNSCITFVKQHYRVLRQDVGYQHPNAMHFVTEKTQERIGRILIDFGHNEVRVVYLALAQPAQGKGCTEGILQNLKLTAKKVGAPLSFVVLNTHLNAIRLYLGLKFQAIQQNVTHTLMMRYPGAGVLGAH